MLSGRRLTKLVRAFCSRKYVGDLDSFHGLGDGSQPSGLLGNWFLHAGRIFFILGISIVWFSLWHVESTSFPKACIRVGRSRRYRRCNYHGFFVPCSFHKPFYKSGCVEPLVLRRIPGIVQRSISQSFDLSIKAFVDVLGSIFSGVTLWFAFYGTATNLVIYQHFQRCEHSDKPEPSSLNEGLSH